MTTPFARLLAALLLAAFALSQSAAAQDASPRGDAARGKQIYANYGCWSCHGYSGAGSIMSGPAVVPMELPFDAFSAQLRQPAASMPPYTKKAFSDQDAADVYAYLRGLALPKRALKDIPLLNE
jgi:mono/diheme cytochrome c family protein